MTPGQVADQLEAERYAHHVREYVPSEGERQAQRRRMLLAEEAERRRCPAVTSRGQDAVA